MIRQLSRLIDFNRLSWLRDCIPSSLTSEFARSRYSSYLENLTVGRNRSTFLVEDSCSFSNYSRALRSGTDVSRSVSVKDNSETRKLLLNLNSTWSRKESVEAETIERLIDVMPNWQDRLQTSGTRLCRLLSSGVYNLWT